MAEKSKPCFSLEDVIRERAEVRREERERCAAIANSFKGYRCPDPHSFPEMIEKAIMARLPCNVPADCSHMTDEEFRPIEAKMMGRSEVISAILRAVQEMFRDGSRHAVRDGMEVVTVIENALGLPLRNVRECVVCKKPVNYSERGVIGSGSLYLMWDGTYAMKHHQCKATPEIHKEWAKKRWWIDTASYDEEPPKDQANPDDPIEFVPVKENQAASVTPDHITG